MEFQVVAGKRLPKICAGRNLIVFYFRRDMEAAAAGIEDRKTDTGTMKISSAALTVLDLLRYRRDPPAWTAWPLSSPTSDQRSTSSSSRPFRRLWSGRSCRDSDICWSVWADLTISRALVEIFAADMLRNALRVRGGTALNKLHFPAPLRYSEDIDLVRTSGGPIGPILDRLRLVLEPWLGRAQFSQSPVAPKLRFRAQAEDGSGAQIRLKLEINTREIEAFDAPAAIRFEVVNPWFSGKAAIATFSREEMLATKLRALLQRDKGRDPYDLAHALEVFERLDLDRIVGMFGRYLELSDRAISRAQAQERMFAKLAHPPLWLDLRPLLSPARAETLTAASTAESFRRVFSSLVDRLPGEPWARTPAMKDRFDIAW